MYVFYSMFYNLLRHEVYHRFIQELLLHNLVVGQMQKL